VPLDHAVDTRLPEEWGSRGEGQAIAGSGLLGEFRRLHGWDEWADDPRFTNEHWQMEQVFLRARAMAQAGNI
jgi:hypothetical protein